MVIVVPAVLLRLGADHLFEDKRRFLDVTALDRVMDAHRLVKIETGNQVAFGRQADAVALGTEVVFMRFDNAELVAVFQSVVV